ncbi:MAG: hypothetical protein M3Y67_07860, partial [Pseudomonadota bacterium]|nr:hypothetical protein [Pseudomonadota bacterium]
MTAGGATVATDHERISMRLHSRIGALARAARRETVDSTVVFLRDTGQGLLEVSHSSLALLGLMLVAMLLFLNGRADLRHDIEARTLSYLQARHEARLDPHEALARELSEPDAVVRA